MKTFSSLVIGAALVIGLSQTDVQAGSGVVAGEKANDGLAATVFLGAYFVPGDFEKDNVDNPGLGTGLGLQYRFWRHFAVTGEFYYGGNVSSGAGSRNWGILPGVRVHFQQGDFELFVGLGMGAGSYMRMETNYWGSGGRGDSTRVAPTLCVSNGVDYRLLSFMSVGAWFRYHQQWLPESSDAEIIIRGFDGQVMYGGAVTFHM